MSLQSARAVTTATEAAIVVATKAKKFNDNKFASTSTDDQITIDINSVLDDNIASGKNNNTTTDTENNNYYDNNTNSII